MLTMICLVVGTVLCFVIAAFCLNNWRNWVDLVGIFSTVIGAVGIIAIMISIVVIVGVHVNPEGNWRLVRQKKQCLNIGLTRKNILMIIM